MDIPREVQSAFHITLLLQNSISWNEFPDHLQEDARVLKVWLDSWPSHWNLTDSKHPLGDFIELSRLVHMTWSNAYKNHVWCRQQEIEMEIIKEAFSESTREAGSHI